MRQFLAILAFVGLSLSFARPAAGTLPGQQVGSELDGDRVVVWINVPGTIESGPDDPCEDWRLYNHTEAHDVPHAAEGNDGLFINRHDDGTISVLYVRFCDSDFEFLWSNQGITLEALALQARDQIIPEPPEVVFAPPGATVRTIVGIDTWFWIPEDQWQPLTATATAGGTTVTATATPLVLIFDPGDGSDPVQCIGPGIAWEQGAESDCAYVYQYVSAHDTSGYWPATVEIEWDIQWETNTGITGELEPLFTVTDTPMLVEEVQITVHSPSAPPAE